MGTYWESFLDELRKGNINYAGEIASFEWLSPAMLLEAFYHWLMEKMNA